MSGTFPSPVALATPNVSNASVQVAPQNLQRLGLYVFNTSATVTLWVAPTPTAAVVLGVGSVAIQPQQGVMFGPPGTPPWKTGMNAIASAPGSNAITILEFYP